MDFDARLVAKHEIGDEALSEAKSGASFDYHYHRGPPQPTWSFLFTPTFITSVQNTDKKLKGRIYDAMTQLYKDPTTEHGNIKRLQRDFDGCYRYRIGRFRLIYRPESSPPPPTVHLLLFGPRADVYSK